MHIKSENAGREYKRDEAIISIAANHEETSSVVHIDVSHAYFDAKTQRLALVRLRVEDRRGTDAGKYVCCRKSMSGIRDATSKIRSVIGRSMSKAGDTSRDSARRICFVRRRTKFRE